MRKPVPILALAALVAAPGLAAAQSGAAPADSLAITLDQAVERALEASEEVRLARSQVRLAGTQVTAARAQALPQVSGTVAYQRTFESPYGGGGFSLPDSLRFSPDSTASIEERIGYLERNADLAGLSGLGQMFGNLPFGQENVYTAQVGVSQLLYSGGRVGAALRIADDYRDAARFTLQEETAEVELQVRTAYYRALLAQELEEIARAALEQAEAFLEEERLRLRAGQASELEVLRAEVSRDNLRPQLVEARNAASLAQLNLKRLVNLPLDAPLRLATELRAPTEAELAQRRLAPEVGLAQRAAIAAAERQVAIREQQIRVARGAFLPNVVASMNYGGQMLPSGALEFDGDWRTDWTASVAVQIPIFSGGQRIAELSQARVERDRAQMQLDQLRESVQLQYEQALGERERAREEISARRTTVEAAERVHDLTVLRYEQGLATQLEVSEARLELLQARTNLAQAIADFHVADAGLVRAVGGAADAAALPGGPEIPDAGPAARPAPRTPTTPTGSTPAPTPTSTPQR